MNDVVVKPRIAWLTVNRSCNFRCRWCYAKGTKFNRNNVANLDYAIRIALLIKELGIKELLIIGGEPTMWIHLLNFNKFCQENSIKTTIVTNAMRFGNDCFWEKYLSNPNTYGGISIKGYDKESLIKVSDVKNFDLTMKGLKRGIAFFKCGVSVVYNQLSSDELVDLASFAMECGAKSFSISPCTPSIDGNWAESEFMVNPEIIVEKVVRDYQKLHSITKGFISFFMKLPLCIWPKDFIETLKKERQITTVCQLQQRAGIIFDYDGNVMMCNGLFSYPIGKYGVDFHNKETFLDFINSHEVNEYYEKINSYPSTKCINCKMFKECCGGCPLLWTVYSPDSIIKGWGN